jgi:hypothetical protein
MRQDTLEVGVLGRPAQGLARAAGICHQHGRIARARRVVRYSTASLL